MCGIAGWIHWQKDLTVEGRTLETMSQTLANRGPDAAGIWLSPHAAFAHRRLIVIDPAGGAQPMIREVGGNQFVIVYNGELYNTEELRQELLSHGHKFSSRSDTEVLLISYIHWGRECVHHLNGIYAFAVWDQSQHTLFMARDRLGVKPLFYYQKGNNLVFGSELKTVLAHPDIPAEIDSAGLCEVFAIGPGRTPGNGVFRDINELRPGHYLVYNKEGLETRRYWQLESHPHEDNLEKTIETVHELVVNAVNRQLVSDVPICTFLSGGLDSSAITALSAEHFVRSGLGTLHTFSVDYVDNDRYFRPSDFQPSEDAPWVKRVSHVFSTHHHLVMLDTDDLVKAMDAALYSRDLPGMADVDISLYLFCQEVKKGATVALSGECADEVFGGYPWFRRKDSLEARTFPWSLTHQVRFQVLSAEAMDWLKPIEYVERRYGEAISEVPSLRGENPQEARVREISYLTLTRWMPTLLDRKDRMSMANGLEVRVPFCDHRLVEYTWNMPWKIKYFKQREKGILREALAGTLPEDVLWRRKSPYPSTHNPSFLAAARSRLRAILFDFSSPLMPLVDAQALWQLISSEDELQIPWFGQLMRLPQLFTYLVQMDLWMRKYRVSIK